MTTNGTLGEMTTNGALSSTSLSPSFPFFLKHSIFFLSLICNVIINIVVFYSICETYNRIVSIQFLTLPLFLFFFFFLFFFCLFKNDNIIQVGDKLSHPFFAYRYIVGFLIFQSLYTFDKLSQRYTYHRVSPNKFNRLFAYFISLILKIHKMSC